MIRFADKQDRHLGSLSHFGERDGIFALCDGAGGDEVVFSARAGSGGQIGCRQTQRDDGNFIRVNAISQLQHAALGFEADDIVRGERIGLPRELLFEAATERQREQRADEPALPGQSGG